MRAVLEDMRTGEIGTYEVPASEIQQGGILVRTAFSAISAGTEKVKVEAGKMSLLGKARARPDLVKQVVEYAQSNGIKAAYQKVRSRLDGLSPMGYSCSGIVLEVDERVSDFRPGDRVACAGGGYANHAEINFVPANLAVHVPENVGLDAASLTTIGAIAMQGVRQANVTLGETVAVIGAGLVGVLTMQIARAAGCRVIAVDLSAQRAQKATELGAQIGVVADDPNLLNTVNAFSHYGVDAVLVTAATSSAEPVETAAKLLRDRGRIVIVGNVGMGVSRGNMYMKELSLLMSRSYGPGRYDPRYEEGGQDYPIGFVRWTERRNMEAFLELLSTAAINVAPILMNRYPVEKSDQAYADLKQGIYTGILDYGISENAKVASLTPRPMVPARRKSGILRVGCIGAGGFASSVIFPNLQRCKGVALESVATRSGVGAESARRSFRFNRAQGPSELIQDPNVDSIFILTQHDTHARYVTDALRAHKAVYVEKPLAVDLEELETLRRTYHEIIDIGEAPFAMVGFNRRFAPLTEKLVGHFSKRTEPMMAHVRINAGFISRDHWTQREGNGGRIVGEFCHFVDWVRFVVGSPFKSIFATTLPDVGRYNSDNLSVTFAFHDGSVAHLLYLANGNSSVPKEYFEVFCEGKVARLDDFKELQLSSGGKTERIKGKLDKGHRREMALTAEAMRTGAPSPISFEELLEVTRATFAVREAIREGRSITLAVAEFAAT